MMNYLPAKKMLNTVIIVMVMMLLIPVSLSAFSKSPEVPPYKEGELLVKFNDNVSEDRIESIISREGATVKKFLRNTRIHILTLPGGMKVTTALERFSSYPEVKYAEPAYRAEKLER